MRPEEHGRSQETRVILHSTENESRLTQPTSGMNSHFVSLIVNYLGPMFQQIEITPHWQPSVGTGENGIDDYDTHNDDGSGENDLCGTYSHSPVQPGPVNTLHNDTATPPFAHLLKEQNADVSLSAPSIHCLTGTA